MNLSDYTQSTVNEKLTVNLAGIKMKNPVMVASGTFGFGLEYEDYVNLNDLGALVVKGTTLQPKPGNEGRRIAETPSGMLNSIGLENPGVDALIEKILPKLENKGVPVIVNISGNTFEEYGELAERLSGTPIAALELNISCPNVKQGGIAFGTEPEMAAGVVSAVKKRTVKPVIVKLSPNVTDVTQIAKRVEAAGADVISLINTLLGMAIDVRSWRPCLGNVVGGLSGPAVKPVALRMVWQTASAVKIPVIGAGGVMNGKDIVDVIRLGGNGVQMGIRFAASEESNAGPALKEFYLKAKPEDVMLINSPVGLPGQAVRNPFAAKIADGTVAKPDSCDACLKHCSQSFCIIKALIRAQQGDVETGLVFTGENVHKIDKILSVKEIIATLVKEAEETE